MFQSLFLWILLSKLKKSPGQIGIIRVSILVFMDLALEALAFDEIKAQPYGFQSLFLWILLSKIVAPDIL